MSPIRPDHRFVATRWDGRSPTYRVELDRIVEIEGAADADRTPFKPALDLQATVAELAERVRTKARDVTNMPAPDQGDRG